MHACENIEKYTRETTSELNFLANLTNWKILDDSDILGH